MRWIHLLVVVVFAAAVVIFLVQNIAIVTVSFLGFSARAPVALIVALAYVLGMPTQAGGLAGSRKAGLMLARFWGA